MLIPIHNTMIITMITKVLYRNIDKKCEINVPQDFSPMNVFSLAIITMIMVIITLMFTVIITLMITVMITLMITVMLTVKLAP